MGNGQLVAAMVLLLGWGGASTATGRTIQWLCDPYTAKQFSDGRPLDDTICFEIGVFADGFVPTALNRDEWSAHWVAAQRTFYYPPTAFFSGIVTVTGNTAPFVSGARAWIWGFTSDLENGEWILASHPDWKWPTPSPVNPNDLDWQIEAATEVLAGTVPAPGGAVAFQTEQVPVSVPPVTTWAQWQQDELSGEPANGPGDDPDHDGLTNIEEYAAGTPPLEPSLQAAARVSLVTVGEPRYPAITVPLRADRVVSVEIGLSEDLEEWNFDPAATVIEAQAAASVTYRSVEPVALNLQQFFRVRWSLVP